MSQSCYLCKNSSNKTANGINYRGDLLSTIRKCIPVRFRLVLGLGNCMWNVLQSTPDNSNLQGKSKKVRVIGVRGIGSSKILGVSKEKTIFTAQ